MREGHPLGSEASARSAFSAVGAVLRLVRPHRVLLIAGMLSSLVGVGLALLQPLVAGRVVSNVSDKSVFATQVGLLISLMILHSVAEASGYFMLEVAGERAIKEVRRDLVRHLLALPLRAFSRLRLGDLISRATSDTALVKTSASHGLSQLVTGLLGAVGAAVLMFYVDKVLCLVTLFSMVAGLALAGVSSRIQKVSILGQESVGTIASDLERALSAIRTVKANQTEQAEEARVADSVDHAYSHSISGAKLVAIGDPVVRLATTGSLVVVLLVGGAQVAAGSVSPAHLVTMMLYAIYLAAPVSDVFQSLSDLQRGVGALRRMHEILDEPAEDIRGQSCRRAGTGGVPSNWKMRASDGLRFESVSFAYDGTNRCVLEDVSFQVDFGSHAGLIGESGAGKSTILSLACRLYAPQSGTIRIGGVDISTLSLRESRSLVGLLDQNAPILYGSLRENLGYGKLSVSDEVITEIIERVNLDGLVRKLPKGLDSQLGEHGALISGGERQRIALGRALLGEPTLLLLDEPTAMLDSDAEGSLVQVFANLKEICTLVTISHKDSTLAHCDTLLRLRDGRVTQTPSLPDLT